MQLLKCRRISISDHDVQNRTLVIWPDGTVIGKEHSKALSRLGDDVLIAPTAQVKHDSAPKLLNAGRIIWLGVPAQAVGDRLDDRRRVGSESGV
jgi:2-keto-3-deoxy-6-phosphogluconate aldolase